MSCQYCRAWNFNAWMHIFEGSVKDKVTWVIKNARFIARKAFRKYSSKMGCLNCIGITRSIILRWFSVFVPFCNSVSTSVPGELPASNPLNFLDFWHAEDLLWSCIELVPVPLGWARTFLQMMHITRGVPMARPERSAHWWKYCHTPAPRRSEFHIIFFLPAYFAVYAANPGVSFYHSIQLSWYSSV